MLPAPLRFSPFRFASGVSLSYRDHVASLSMTALFSLHNPDLFLRQAVELVHQADDPGVGGREIATLRSIRLSKVK